MVPDAGRTPDDFSTSSDIPHMPWEDTAAGLLERLWGTLGSTFHPVRDVARVSHGPINPAVRFALWTALPVAFAAGLIPLTELLLFDSGGAMTVQEGASQDAILLDVLRAGSLGMVSTVCAWLVSAYAFVTLAHAFADPALAPVHPHGAAWRVALYRAWLLPAGMGGFFLMAWLGPEINESRLYLLELAFHVLPGVVQMLNYSGVARYLGASSLAGLGAAFVPVLVFQFALTGTHMALVFLGVLDLPQPPPAP